MKHRIYRSLLATVLLLGATALHAQIPTVMSYQGFLSTDTGAYSGTVPVNLTLYDSPTSGNLVWSEVTNGVQVQNGYYTVLMHLSQNWTNGNVNFDKQYYLEVLINNTLMGRVQLTISPYAYNAKIADSAIHIPQSPVGTIVAYGGQALTLDQEEALGWYVCNGDSISITDHKAYVDAVGQTYGLSRDRKYVYLPDFRGLFLRGVNDGRDDGLKDPDAASRFAMRTGGFGGDHVGTIQGSAFANHRHAIYDGQASAAPSLSGGGGRWIGPANSTNNNYMGVTGEQGSSTETRPSNASVYWLIKVR